VIYFNCGCGFRTDQEGRAMLHVAETRHTVMVLGRITPREVGAVVEEATPEILGGTETGRITSKTPNVREVPRDRKPKS